MTMICHINTSYPPNFSYDVESIVIGVVYIYSYHTTRSIAYNDVHYGIHVFELFCTHMLHTHTAHTHTHVAHANHRILTLRCLIFNINNT